ncbi:MAG: HIT family protein [Minisyncoccota bacterium]
MEDTVFMKIIRREIPAHIVYEDDDTIAFLDATPIALGHTLVIPKKFARNIFDVDDATLAAVMRTVRKVAPAVRDAVGAHGVHINSNHESAAGQVVFHLHFHIIPRHDRNEFSFWPSHDIATDDAKGVAEKIRDALVP